MTRFQGAIFDVDGVLVDSPHEKSWRESLLDFSSEIPYRGTGRLGDIKLPWELNKH